MRRKGGRFEVREKTFQKRHGLRDRHDTVGCVIPVSPGEVRRGCLVISLAVQQIEFPGIADAEEIRIEALAQFPLKNGPDILDVVFEVGRSPIVQETDFPSAG